MLDTAIIPFSYAQNEVRVVTISNETLFVGKDICSALSIKGHRRALSELDDDERGEYGIRTPFGDPTFPTP